MTCIGSRLSAVTLAALTQHSALPPAASGGELAVALGPADLCPDDSSEEGGRALSALAFWLLLIQPASMPGHSASL